MSENIEMRICKDCKLSKPITEYRKNNKTGHKTVCRPCFAKETRIYNAKKRALRPPKIIVSIRKSKHDFEYSNALEYRQKYYLKKKERMAQEQLEAIQTD
jgi:hypothetical protein